MKPHPNNDHAVDPSVIPADGTFVSLIRRHAQERPDATALVFTRDDEEEALTYRALDIRARRFGSSLRSAHPPGALVLLPMRSDAHSVVALLACLYAGLPCAPVPLPGRNGSVLHLRAIAAGSGCSVAIVPPDAQHLDQVLSGIAILTEDACTGDPDWTPEAPSGSALAIVQYTSGSTAEPKGVRLTHANIAANLAMLRTAFAVQADDVYASWLPLFHDMGLAMLLMPLHFGVPGHLMAPLSFLRRPALWLQEVTRSGATITGAPNFAYETCVARVSDAEIEGLDLRRLRLAFCGAEPVRLATMRRFARRFAPAGFRPEALYPCYGMAEAVTFVTGGHLCSDAKDESVPISCGPPAQDTQIAIVDRDTGGLCSDGEIGEIWVSGLQIGDGYHRAPQATAASFGAHLTAFPSLAFLRTGDLGFLAGGELTITGRLKDVIIHRGTNIHAADVEAVVAECHPGFGAAGAAFACTVDGVEQVVLVHEAARGFVGPAEPAMRRAALDAVAFHHGVRLHDLVLVRAGSVPKTSSGKVRRGACRELYARRELRLFSSSE